VRHIERISLTGAQSCRSRPGKGRPSRRWRPKANLHFVLRHPRLFLGIYRWPILVLLVGLIVDGITTYRFVGEFGPRSELHPAMWIVLEVLGRDVGIVVGSIGRLIAVIFVAGLFRKWRGRLLLICGILYCLAAVSNHFRLLDRLYLAL